MLGRAESAPSAPLRGPQGSRSPRLHGPLHGAPGEPGSRGEAPGALGGPGQERGTSARPKAWHRARPGAPGRETWGGGGEAGLPAPERFRSGQSGRGAGELDFRA